MLKGQAVEEVMTMERLDLSYNTKTMNVIFNDDELKINIIDYIKIKEKYGHYLEAINMFGGYMFLQHFLEFSSLSKAQTYVHVRDMEKLYLINVKRISNSKYAMITRKGMTYLKQSNNVGSKVNPETSAEILKASAYMADIYLKYKSIPNFLLVGRFEISKAYERVLKYYESQKSNKDNELVKAFEGKSHGKISKEYRKTIKLDKEPVKEDYTVGQGVWKTTKSRYINNYIAGGYIYFKETQEAKNRAGWSSFDYVSPLAYKSFGDYVEYRDIDNKTCEVTFTTRGEVEERDRPCKDYWVDQWAKAKSRKDNHPNIPLDSISQLLHRRVYIGWWEEIKNPFKIVVTIIIPDLRKSNLWIRKTLKHIDDVFLDLNEGLKSPVIEYNIIFACGDKDREIGLKRILDDIMKVFIRSRDEYVKLIAKGQNASAVFRSNNSLWFMNDWKLENLDTERFIRVEYIRDKSAMDIKPNEINVLEFKEVSV